MSRHRPTCLVLFSFALMLSFSSGCTTVSPHSVVVTSTYDTIGISGTEMFIEKSEACSSSILLFPSTGDASLYTAMKKLNYEKPDHRLAYVTADIRSTWSLFSTSRCTVVRGHFIEVPRQKPANLFGEETEDDEPDVSKEDGDAHDSQPTSSSVETKISGKQLTDSPAVVSENGIVLGTPVRVRTKTGRTAEGIFKSFRNDELVILVTADAELRLAARDIDWLAKVADSSDE